MFCCQWVLYSSYVPGPNTIIASLAIWDQMSKDVGDPLRDDEKFMIKNLSLSYRHFVPTHPSYSWFWSESHRIDPKRALRHICCLKFCLDFLRRLMNFIQVVGSPSCIFHVIVPDEIRKIYWVHVGADPRFPLCEDETATRWCGLSVLWPHQNITLGSNIALCSMLELFCCM